MPNSILIGTLLAASAALPRAWQRLELSRAKHRSLAGHSRIARRFASLIPGYSYGPDEFFRADGAPNEIEAQRRHGFEHVSKTLRERCPRTLELTARTQPSVSDLQFTGSYRVPFQFSAYCREHLPIGAFLESSADVRVKDLDGNEFIDLAGSYGVNVFGYDFYKECIRQATDRAEELGPVLGAYHPSLSYNVERLCAISGLDEVSFHMSGTEAVMQAVRLARHHTGRKRLVRFCGAYHGWWDDVQPGPGAPILPANTYTLAEMSPRSLHVIRTRRDIACVLVNPLQALHPNVAAPSDSTLVDSARTADFDRVSYSAWLKELRQACSDNGVALIFDEVLLGFRLAPGGAQEYFGVRADLVTYGKTLAGGLPIGALCGRKEFMRRFDERWPARICFARGTFNSHPYVMTCMQAFLERLESPEVKNLYRNLDSVWENRARQLNGELRANDLPVRVSGLSTIWTVLYELPSRYNWMFQYYLRIHGLSLSWVGTGRLIFPLACTDAHFAEISRRFIGAAQHMKSDGWWHAEPARSNRSIRRSILKEMLRRRLGIG
jgi:glutamate-1-semialdehyde 2,1-aminomutase